MLYIVATPIGNLMDLSPRAIEILTKVNFIAAENPKRSSILLKHYHIHNKVISLHEHNEQQIINKLLPLLQQQQDIALISDAGTPLISDPGYHLVNQAHHLHIPVSPIPGPSAVIAAISVSGLPTNQFVFIGFLPAKLTSKQHTLTALVDTASTMIFFEAPHRLLVTIRLMQTIFGVDRPLTFCRELTKKFETIVRTTLGGLDEFIQADETHQTKGEIVLVVAGKNYLNRPTATKIADLDSKTHQLFSILLTELSVAKAAKVGAKITGISREEVYAYLINLQR